MATSDLSTRSKDEQLLASALEKTRRLAEQLRADAQALAAARLASVGAALSDCAGAAVSLAAAISEGPMPEKADE